MTKKNIFLIKFENREKFVTKTHFKIWIAECYSCQIDVIELLKQSSLAPFLTIFCSHTRLRPELQTGADYFFQQPKLEQSANWLLEQCQQHQIDLVFCGKKGEIFEQYRSVFEQNQIQLVTGTLGSNAHAQINHKFQFTEKCQQFNLPVIPAQFVVDAQSLKAGIAAYQKQYSRICVKPVYGVYGLGFAELIDDLSYFRHFQQPDVCNTQQFIQAYQQQEKPPAYLVMPFIAGQECSVDVACHRGQVLALVTRVKFDFYQQCYTEHECHSIAKKLVDVFQCDGLINIQFRQDEQQNWHILEINPRPAGAFAYTQHTGINLVATLIAHKLNLPNQTSTVIQPNVRVLPMIKSKVIDQNI